MRVLLDQCVPENLRHAILGHEVVTVRFAGLVGLTDCDLLDAADGTYDVLVSCDRGLASQQNMGGRKISVVVLLAATNRLPELRPLVPHLLVELESIRPGEVRRVGLSP